MYFIMWHFCQNYNNTMQVEILFFSHPVLRARKSFTNSNCPWALWEVQTAEHPIRMCEISLPYNNTGYSTVGKSH